MLPRSRNIFSVPARLPCISFPRVKNYYYYYYFFFFRYVRYVKNTYNYAIVQFDIYLKALHRIQLALVFTSVQVAPLFHLGIFADSKTSEDTLRLFYVSFLHRYVSIQFR